MSLRFKVVAALLTLALACPAVIGWLAYRTERQAIEQRIRADFQNRAREAMGRFDQRLYYMRRNVRAWAGLDVMQELITGDVDGKIARFLVGLGQQYDDFAGIAALNAQGEVVAASNLGDIGQTREGRDAPDGGQIRDAVWREGAGWVVTLTFPIRARFGDGGLVGFLRAEWKVGELFKLLTDSQAKMAGELVLTRKDGTILSKPATGSAGRVEARLNHGEDGYVIETDPNGRQQLVGFCRSRGYRDFAGLGWATFVREDADTVFAPVRQLRVSIFKLGAVVGVIVLIMTMLVASRLTRPILEISLAAQRAAGGDYAARVDYGARDELGSLARHFNQMLARIQARDEALKRSNAELEDFANVASHDLQEPLRKIQAFGDRLKTKFAKVLGDDGRDYLERMQNAAARMQTLINDLLAFSRITTKAQPFVPVDLNQVAHEVLSDLEVRIEQTGARVEVSELSTVDADPLQMRQLLQNLIGNALKFRREYTKPVIKVAAHANGDDCCRLTVEDNGIGFDMKYLDRIFGMFQRLHGRDQYEGTGVGLAICRKIAERHGGQITAQSSTGQGATFIVTLPVHHRGEQP